MNSLRSITWPRARHSDFEVFRDAIYCGAMGFEDRSLAFLEVAKEKQQRLDAVIGIEYLPFLGKNRKSDFLRLANGVSDHVRVLDYDRFAPEQFADNLPITFEEFAGKHVVLDISGLSKLGIVIATQALSKCYVDLTVFYSEALVYPPTREEFEIQRAKLSSAETPAFLTTQVHDIIGTAALSSVSMPGAPIALVAFPTFNHVELRALLNEVTPQRLFLLNGLPPDPSNSWRREAVSELNARAAQHVDDDRTVSTLEYLDTLEALETFYDRTRYTHRLVVAPTGSKMQSLSVSLFKQIHPDVQIIYPVAEGFAHEYTSGWSNLWQIDFGNFHNFASMLQSLRKRVLLELVSKLAKSNEKS